MAASPKAEETADRIHGAAIRVLRFVRRADAAAGLPPAQLSALSVLVFAGPQSLASLAAAEQVKPPTMSQLVAQMLRNGLVTREPADRRSIRISATEEGRRLMEAGRRRRLAMLTRALSPLPGKKLAELQAAADLVCTVIETGR